jgi:adenosylmethionine-8-amino-7-oxononanoate aminotransferase
MNNEDLLRRSLDAVWHPCTQMKVHETLPLVPIRRGEGAWLEDFNGRRYLDVISSWWVNLFGHGNPRINAALRDQLEQLEHVMLAGFTHDRWWRSPRSSRLTGHALGHCFYASDGASAVEIALKMSFHFWRNTGQPGKNRFVSLAGSYHGETLGALAVTDVALFRDAYAPLLRRDARPNRAASRESAARSPKRRRANAPPRTHAIAALIVSHGAGAPRGWRCDPRYRARRASSPLRCATDRRRDHDGIRPHRNLFACEQAGVTGPACLSKGITGGYLPLSAVLCTDAVYAAFYDDDPGRGFLHSHSYTGNALACRAALAVLDIFRDDDVVAANRTTAEHWRSLAAPLARHPRVRHFRQRGMILAFDVETARPDFARWFFAEALARELLLRPIGRTVYLMPPYIVTDAEFELLATRVAGILDAA